MNKIPEIPFGTAALIDGKLIVKESEDGEFPKITVGENVIVKINGEEVHGTIEIKENFDIEVLPKKIVPETEFLLKISKDNLKANLEILKHKGKKFILEYTSASKDLLIETKRYDIIEPKKHTVEDLKEFLKNEGIIFGIIEEALIKITEEKADQSIVAKGISPEKGEDAKITIIAYEKKEENKEDIKNIIGKRSIFMVEKNQPIAVKIPPKPGKAGTDVFGKTIPPENSKDIRLIAGHGAGLNEDESMVYAKIDGKLQVDKTYFSVLPVYYVEGDVEAKEGYVDFNGDIKVTGNVLDGMKLNSKGKIEILGFAANSELTASKDIIVEKSIVSSFVKTGTNVFLFRQMKENLKIILNKTSDMINAFKQMKKLTENSKEKVKEGQLLKYLLESKYTEIPQLFSNSLQMLNNLECEIDELSKDKLKKTIKIIESWQKKTSGLGPFEIKKVGDLEYMLRELNNCSRELINIFDEGSENASITCGYVQNSKLEASGDIIINGKECYNSNLVSGGKVSIQGIPGVFRGGSITALGDIKVNKLGSKTESKGFVQLGNDSTLYADVIYPGIMIRCGSFIKKIKETEYNYKFSSTDI